MKNLVNKVLVFALGVTITAAPLFARTTDTEASSLSVKLEEMANLKFSLKINAKQRTLVSIQSESNETLFSDYALSDKQYVRTLDLSNLTDGTYAIVIKSGKEKVVKSVNIKTQTSRSAVLQ